MRIHHPASRLFAVLAFALSIGLSSVAFGNTAGQYIDDATLTAKVKTALLAEAPLKALKIDVDTSNQVVTLTGTVNSESQETEALRVARQVEGVKSVKDMLTVKETAQ